jgi:hypothetical protein
MNNLFKIRKINKALKIFSDSFLGFSDKEIDQDIKEFYEKELKNNGLKFKLNFISNENKRFNLSSPNMDLFVNINTF